ncbi:MAG: BTB/POZ domain-containing protein, partial [Chlamydiia bacterium]|nr:BTB/POZ domain-containing protein [Chlamydiia bacterium]
MHLVPTFWFTPLKSSEAFAPSSEGKEIVVVEGSRERTLDEDAETLLEEMCRIGKGLLGEPAWISPKALKYNAKILFSQLRDSGDEECLMLRLCRAVASWYQNEVRLGRTQFEALYRPDYTFYVGASHFPMRAHRSVLGNYSFWKGRFNSGMKDADLNVQIVLDAEPYTFSLFLNYLYGSPLNPGRLSLKKLEKLHFLADYFCLVRLEKGLEAWIKYLKGKKFFQKVEELLEEHPLHRSLAGVIANLPREQAPKSLTDRTIWTTRGEEGPFFDEKGANKAALIARTEQLGRGATDDFGVTTEFMQAWLDFAHLSVGRDPYFERLYEMTRNEVLHAYPLMQREGLFFERAG